MKKLLLIFLLLIPTICFAQDRVVIRGKNFAGKTTSNKHNIDFINCNFMQKVPYTKVFFNSSGLRFKECNLTNADVPKDSIIRDCNTTQVVRTKTGEKVTKQKVMTYIDTGGGYVLEKVEETQWTDDIISYTHIQ